MGAIYRLVKLDIIIMVTKEEFEQFIAEVESFRDLFMEELEKMKTDIEIMKDTLNEVIKETKVDVNRKIG